MYQVVGNMPELDQLVGQGKELKPHVAAHEVMARHRVGGKSNQASTFGFFRPETRRARITGGALTRFRIL
jgi:hypothetical protein